MITDLDQVNTAAASKAVGGTAVGVDIAKEGIAVGMNTIQENIAVEGGIAALGTTEVDADHTQIDK